MASPLQLKSYLVDKTNSLSLLLKEISLKLVASFRSTFTSLLSLLPNTTRVNELAKAHTVGLTVGLRSFFSSKPVLMGMGAGLSAATISAIFLPPVAPIMLYLSFAKTALIAGSVFGIGSSLIQGLSNFFTSFLNARDARKVGEQRVDFDGIDEVSQLPKPPTFLPRLMEREQGPLAKALHDGIKAANNVVPTRSKVHYIYLPGDKVTVNNALSLAEQVVDGDRDVITQTFRR